MNKNIKITNQLENMNTAGPMELSLEELEQVIGGEPGNCIDCGKYCTALSQIGGCDHRCGDCAGRRMRHLATMINAASWVDPDPATKLTLKAFALGARIQANRYDGKGFGGCTVA
jgi:hypothetical protein